jgi:hypothetical protein
MFTGSKPDGNPLGNLFLRLGRERLGTNRAFSLGLTVQRHPQRIFAQLNSAILPSVPFRFGGRTTKRVDLSTHALVDCEKAQDAWPGSLVARWEVNEISNKMVP